MLKLNLTLPVKTEAELVVAQLVSVGMAWINKLPNIELSIKPLQARKQV